MLHAIEAARSQLLMLNDVRRREKLLDESLESFVQQVRSAFEAAGRAAPADHDVPKSVSALVIELDQAEEDRRQTAALEEAIRASDGRIAQLQSQIDQRQEEIGCLLAAAGTVDEEAFRRRATECEARRNLEGQIRQIEIRLRQLAGGGDAVAVLGEELGRTTPESLASEAGQLEGVIRAKEEEKTDAADKRGQLRQQLEQLESSEEISRLRLEERTLVADFQSQAEEWSVLKIAAHLIEKAREKYERERRPTVLKEAERFFARFTTGNYTEIRTPAANSIMAIAPNGTAKDAGQLQLSRGTAEQLYLSLRFGFVREFVGRSEPLPLVFDDILVNFDPARARATAAAIRDLSESLQIFLFTCHPTTVQLIREVDGGVPVFSLKDGRLTSVGSL